MFNKAKMFNPNKMDPGDWDNARRLTQASHDPNLCGDVTTADTWDPAWVNGSRFEVKSCLYKMHDVGVPSVEEMGAYTKDMRVSLVCDPSDTSKISKSDRSIGFGVTGPTFLGRVGTITMSPFAREARIRVVGH